MNNNDVCHVAAMPPQDVTPALISKAADILSQPLYQIRMLLAGRLPKILGRFRDEPTAAAAIGRLRKLGMTAFVVTESELRNPVYPDITARSLKIEDNQTVFISRDGSNEALNNTGVFLLLTGRRTSVIESATIPTSTMKVNLPATLLTGGIPVMKRVISETKEGRKSTEQFIRLYRKGSDVPAVEIRQFDFDYSFLRNRMDPTATCNIVETVTELRRFFAGAYFNDSLLNGFVAEPNSITGINIGEQSCLLLVRYYRTLANDVA
jgi:hypothetical protein